MTRIGSLFSGAAGLDRAVEAVFGGRTVWHCELDAAAAKVLAHRFPDVPNLGDITKVDWNAVEPVDIICGGFPCTDVSAAGKRAGMHGTRSGLWSFMRDAIDALRPRFVVIENVRGLLNANANRPMEPDSDALGDNGSVPVLRAIGAVLGDLADIGTYDARWVTVSAASVGAPHRRERVFILAADAGCINGRPWRTQHGWVGAASEQPQRSTATPTGRPESAGFVGGSDAPLSDDGPVELLPTPNAADGARGQDFARASRDGSGGDDLVTLAVKATNASQWGKYEPAIRRWESVTRPAPAPTEPNKNGNPRLAARFSEWMMGWPAGWVTDVPSISRNDMLRIIGNGVVVQQCEAALRWLLNVSEVAA